MAATREASGGLEAALEELFGTTPAEFTKTRDALGKRLKASGDEAAAAEVRGRRKPTQIAWVLNQLARRHPDEVAELVDVGRELLREQRKALRGDAKTSLRESIERQRKVIADLTRIASKVMADLGVPAAGLDEVASSLRAALVDPVVGARLEEGRLEKAPEPTAGFAGPMPDVAMPERAEAPAPKKPAPARETAAAKKKAQAAEQKARAKRIAEERAAAAKAAKADDAAKKKERSNRLAEERARKKAVAKALTALHAAEAAAKKQEAAASKARAEADKIRREADRADARATKLEAAASESAARADEARRAVEELGG